MTALRAPRGTATRPSATTPSRRVDPGYRVIALRVGGLGVRWPLRSMVVCLLLAAAVVAVTTWALALGDYPLSVAEVWGALLGDRDAGFARIVVTQWRLPRAAAAITLGAALGVAGGVFQSLTRNPLASPDIIGFSTGAYTGALVVMILLGGSYLQVTAGALVGGIATAAVVYLLAFRRGVLGFRLIIVGIGVAAMLGSFNTWLMLTAELETALNAAVWGAGTLAGISWSYTLGASLLVLALLLATTALAPGLRRLELGDDAATALGTRTEPARLLLMVVGVALTAIVTAAAGPIAFVALAAPQIARRLARTPGISLVPAALTGALLLSTADLVAQHALPRVLPVGVVTVVVGGSYLVWLLIHEVRRRRSS